MMSATSARLPEPDLARVAAMSDTDQRRYLANLKSGPPSITYRPARRFMPDALNIQAALPMMVDTPSKDTLIQQVRAAARNVNEADSNAEVIDLTYDLVRDRGIVVEAYEFGALKLSAQYGVTFWSNAIFREDNKLFVIIPDFRRGKGFNQSALKFVVSAAHERIRKMGVEFADIEFAILSFPAHKNRPRTIKLEPISMVDLFSYEQLREMTEATLAIWRDVCDQRLTEQRKKAANDDDSLFGWASRQKDAGGKS